MKLQENLFDLTQEQTDASKLIYNGKVIKCLVAPYHSFMVLEKLLPYRKTTFLFPEREMSEQQCRGFISMVVSNQQFVDDVYIITTNYNIIIDMIDSSVRILTEGGDVVVCPEKTFMANIHTIKYKLLENESHQLSKHDKSIAKDKINILIKKINSTTKFTTDEYENLLLEIKHIGEPFIREKLIYMLNDKK